MAAFLLDRSVWTFGMFVENMVSRFSHASKETGRKGKTKAPTEHEVREYRRALIDQTVYSRKRARPPRRRLSSLAGGKNPNAGRKIVQRLGGPVAVE